jgi:Subtilisin-like serine proteases
MFSRSLGLLLTIFIFSFILPVVFVNISVLVSPNIDPAIKTYLSRYGSVEVYVVYDRPLSNCLWRFGTLCISKYNVTSESELSVLSSKAFSVWSYLGKPFNLSYIYIRSLSLSELKDMIDYKRYVVGATYPAVRVKDFSVAIIDTGIDYTHPDLKDSIVRLVSVTVRHVNGSPVEASSPDEALEIDEVCRAKLGVSCFYDEVGHGTFVAGIISGSGVGCNGSIRGLAPYTPLVIVKAFQEATTSVDLILDALKWVYDNADKYRIKVVIASWGIYGATTGFDPISLVIDYLYISKGIITFVASGNEGRAPFTLTIPSGSKYAVVVGSWNPIDREPSKFTSCGTTTSGMVKPDFCGVGEYVLSTTPMGYGVGAGTSFANPMVAGLFIQYLQLYYSKYGEFPTRFELEEYFSRRIIWSLSGNKDVVCGWGVPTLP